MTSKWWDRSRSGAELSRRGLFLLAGAAWAQPAGFNYDESKVPPYTLPDLLGGAKTKADWLKKRRPEILEMFRAEMYGRTPSPPPKVTAEVVEIDENALGGKAIRKQVALRYNNRKDIPATNVLLYLPKSAKKVPVFVGLNFQGNQTVHNDEAIRATPVYEKGKPVERARGAQASRWEVELILSRGYGLATANYNDVDPDFDDGFQNGVHPLYPRAETPDAWGAIGAWAWGMSRMLDYLETESRVDAKRVAVTGHSRLGKAALWAGAQDERFALVISNDSGAGGAALSKRIFGETVARLNTSFPHWFAKKFRDYNEKEGALPFDQHMLIALIAPRPVYVASAAEDLWADPKGEFLGALHAAPAYRLLGAGDFDAKEMPGIHQPVMSRIGYHIRAGKHDVTRYDWEQYLNFADKHMK
ncbi:MAG: acetylxylan esterase [Bryobacter sp.]|nr:acetylxylan esterase [Bryobacter sp.]